MWRPRPGKREAQVRHAKRRANERYGLKLDDNDLLQITRMVQRGEGTFIERQSVRVALWDIVWQGVPVRIAYDGERHTPVTFLYRDRKDYDDACGISNGLVEQPELSMSDAMSMYKALMGENPAAPDLLGLLGLDKTGIPRYRDCWLAPNLKYIHLLTRTGGNNRRDYLDEIDRLRRIDGFQGDYDDLDDPTFMHFVYKRHVNVQFASNDCERGPGFLIKAIATLREHGLSEPHPNAKLEAIRQGSMAVMRRVIDAMSRAPSGTIVRIGDDGKIMREQ